MHLITESMGSGTHGPVRQGLLKSDGAAINAFPVAHIVRRDFSLIQRP